MVKDILDGVLKKTDIPFYYFERPTDVFPCVVVSYQEATNYSADNVEEGVKYDIYLNLITKDNIRNHTKKIKDCMSDDFSKIIINAPMKLDGVDYFQITMNYRKSVGI
jgi:hypothetical protein